MRRRPSFLRAIAADAMVDQKLIAHYFGSKQQLFVAVIGLPFNPGEALREALAGDPSQTGQRLAALLIDLLEQPTLHERLTGVIRAAASEPNVARMLREFPTRELFRPVAAFLEADDADARNRSAPQPSPAARSPTRSLVALKNRAGLDREAKPFDLFASVKQGPPCLHRHLFKPVRLTGARHELGYIHPAGSQTQGPAMAALSRAGRKQFLS